MEAEFEAEHPCLPQGFTYMQDIPSLIYPEGRAFLDMDLRAILAYMEALGMDINSDVVRRNFPSTVVDQVKSSTLTKIVLKPEMQNLVRQEATILAHNRTPPQNSEERRGLAALGLYDANATTADRLKADQSLLKNVAIANDEAEPFHPFAEPLPDQKIRYRVIFSGTSDYQECKKRAFELFYKEPCFLSTCSFNGVYQPRIAESKFLALGQYAKIRTALGIPLTATPDTLARKVAEICAMPWAQLEARQRAGEFKPFGKKSIAKLCWKATWAHATLTRGFGLDGESKAVTFYDFPINAPEDALMSPGWALGSMLAEISFFPWQTTRGRYKAVFFWALSSTLCLLGLSLLQHIKISELRAKREAMGTLRSDVYQDLVSGPSPLAP
eukprot:Blabericola_migrator_1__756@NODE_1189_length_5170_cov_62_720752_g808_i0_p2_GENE_NODE_1189_length_5170_cov_62_720752_g808_i0NODE_1189_length_5170_cov_62_720752_g808_i0_p2_ORF_typecomplete_len385_score63_38GDA1_CD39/PF01150_17/2_4e23_NODE_1189_length_5170_cov_62_720752_g808_i029324086